MAKEGLQYKTVVDICNKLVAGGHKPSYTLVTGEIDGSPSKTTVLKHIAAWKEARLVEATTKMAISVELNAALAQEIASHVEAAVAKEGQRVTNAKTQAEEATELLSRSEKELTLVREELAAAKAREGDLRQECREAAAAAGEKISGLEARLAEEISRNAGLDLKLERRADEIAQLTGESADGRQQLSGATVQVERLNDKLVEVENDRRASHGKIETLREAVVSAQKTAAVMEEKALAAQTRVVVLEKAVAQGEILERTASEALSEANLKVEKATGRAVLAEQRVTQLEEKIAELKTGGQK